MGETGLVIAVNGETVTLRMRRTSACSKCRACTVIGKTDELRIEARNECGAVLNDTVQVALRPETFLTAVFILYGLPLIGFVLGCGLGAFLGIFFGWGRYNALSGLGAGITMAFFAYGIIKKLEPYWKKRGFTPAAAVVVKD